MDACLSVCIGVMDSSQPLALIICCLYVCVYVCMHVCMYVCMYVCNYLLSFYLFETRFLGGGALETGFLCVALAVLELTL